jgi:NADH-quinone oxidoreductase subunit E
MSLRRLAPPDIQPASFAFDDENEKRVAYEIAKYPPGRQASAVISLLWIGQEQQGWVTHPMIEAIGKRLEMPFIRVLEVATFYTMFNLAPVGKYHLQVCTTPPCMLRNSDDIVKACETHIGHAQMTPTADGMLSWTEVECLGACTNAPVFQVGRDFYEDLDTDSTVKLIEAFRKGQPLKAGSQIGRASSEPVGGLNTLTDRSIYARGQGGSTPHNDGPALTDSDAKKPTDAASDRESPAQKPPGAAT